MKRLRIAYWTFIILLSFSILIWIINAFANNPTFEDRQTELMSCAETVEQLQRDLQGCMVYCDPAEAFVIENLMGQEPEGL